MAAKPTNTTTHSGSSLTICMDVKSSTAQLRPRIVSRSICGANNEGSVCCLAADEPRSVDRRFSCFDDVSRQLDYERDHATINGAVATIDGSRCTKCRSSVRLRLIASADGRRVDPTRALPDVDYSATSAFDWPIERPSAADWRIWQAFLQRLTLPDGTLLRTLGKWLYPSHRKWEWFYDPVSDTITRRLEDRQDLYCLCPDDGPSTRQAIDAGETIQRLAAGPPLAVTASECQESFFEFLRTWKGEWMWEDLHMPLGLDAVVSSIRNGSAIYVTDGSYMRTLDPLIDGAGWLIYCRTARRIVLKGSMAERNSNAGSYRGELLGLLAIHLWVAAVEEFYRLEEGPRGLIACDNLGALNKAQLRRKKIRAGAKHSDILRVLRRLHNRRRGCKWQAFEYKHVYGHQDQLRLWSRLTLLEKLNCKCDSLAKAAVSRALREGIPITNARQLLPSESVAVFYNKGKLSSECGDDIRYQVGRVKARQFYVTQLGWSGAAFDQVDWEARDHALRGKPDMFKTWLAKQTSTFCATGLNMVRWFDSEVSECPNCGAPDERASHLLHCPDPGRFRLFRDRLQELGEWLRKPHTDPILADILEQYIFHRGEKTLASLCQGRQEFLKFAHAQDFIGWDHFLEGKIALELTPLLRDHLLFDTRAMDLS
eukprot:scaffold15270_cov101-Cyclotella_meneghiniana.AAC.2